VKKRILAVGLDEYWLTAVKNATATRDDFVHTRTFSGDPLKCNFDLPRPNAWTLLLLDASGQVDMKKVVTKFRSAGWKYVVVVAADLSSNQAVSVLRGNLSYDYWPKTYDKNDIRERIELCFDEIRADKENKRKRNLLAE
jgi:hypothetical protein